MTLLSIRGVSKRFGGLQAVDDVFKALADPTRIMLLYLLADCPKNVGELGAALIVDGDAGIGRIAAEDESISASAEGAGIAGTPPELLAGIRSGTETSPTSASILSLQVMVSSAF